MTRVELNFSLIGGGFTDRSGSPHVIPLARVLQTDRRTPLVGARYRAQLYVGSSPKNLLPAGNPQPFYDSSYVAAYPSFAGIFPPTSVLLPDAVPHQRLFVQIRVWDASYGAAFESARDNGSPVGSSRIISVAAGSEASGGAMLFGMQTFALRAGQVSTP